MLGAALSIVGCDDSENGSIKKIKQENAAQATITAQNATFFTDYKDKYIVDLSDKVIVSGDGRFQLARVEPLNESAKCSVLEVSTTSFTIPADSPSVCVYRYYVSPVSAKSANALNQSVSKMVSAPLESALTRVAVASESTELSVISYATRIEEEVVINVSDELRKQTGYLLKSGFVLDSNLTLPYSGSVAYSESLTNTISYTPPAGFEGVERILFSYSNDTTGEVLLGTLDIAVAQEVNQGLTVEDRIVHSVVDVNVETTIDVSPYITSLDGDDYQLVYVDSFNAATVPASNSFSNKAFTFITSRLGNHHVSFAVSDHNGQYAMGTMKIPSYPILWTNINDKGFEFSAPLTSELAVAFPIVYDASLQDASYTPAVELALFDATSAKSYCHTLGRLPESSELVDLAVSTNSIRDTNNWPVATPYLAADNGVFKTVDMTTMAVDDYIGGNFIVSCIEGGVSAEVQSNPIVANGTTATVVFRFLALGGKPIEGEVITFSNAGEAILDELSGVTNEQGYTSATLSTIRAEDVQVCGQVGMTSSCATVNFIADRATAKIDSVSLDVRNWLSGDSGVYNLSTTVSDANSNPIPNEAITLSVIEDAGAADMVIVDKDSYTHSDGISTHELINNQTGVLTDTVKLKIELDPSVTSSYTARWGEWNWDSPLELSSFRLNTGDTNAVKCASRIGPGWRDLKLTEYDEYNAELTVNNHIDFIANGETRDPISRLFKDNFILESEDGSLYNHPIAIRTNSSSPYHFMTLTQRFYNTDLSFIESFNGTKSLYGILNADASSALRGVRTVSGNDGYPLNKLCVKAL
ncbi:Ig-like domain-containing protein [Vibrio jasicida]|uniref:Ig-like domain-containing protein n=1 Tax=Vibrio jasicida TaxID=766224 RepID=UPI004069226E